MGVSNLIRVIAIALLSTSCVTGISLRNPKIDANSVHVHETNGQDVLTKLDRSQWINIRKSSSSSQLRLYSSLGAREWDVAIKDARHFLSEHPKDMVALHVLSVGLAMKKNYNLASYYAKLLDKYHPEQIDTLNIQGLAIINQPGASFEDFNKALNLFEKSFEQNEKAVASGLNLGYLHLQMGNAEAARDIFKAVGGRCGGCEAALSGQGIAATRLKDYPDAKLAFEKILDSDDKNLEAKYYVAVIESSGFQNNKGAIKMLGQIMASNDKDNNDLKRRANFLMRRLEAQVQMREAMPKADPVESVPENVEMALDEEKKNESKDSEIVTEADLQDVEGIIPVSSEEVDPAPLKEDNETPAEDDVSIDEHAASLDENAAAIIETPSELPSID